jgi:heme/copper-type cytochrome/quinol oxidase subunit 2
MSELPQDSGTGSRSAPASKPESLPVPIAETAPIAAQVYAPPLQSQPQPRAPQTSLGCLIGAGIIAAALLIAGLLVASALRDSANRVAGTAEKMNPVNIVATLIPAVTPTIVVRPPAVLSVRAISDLATAQSLMSTVVEAEQARIGNVIYEKLVLIACGRVKAGIDLSQLKESDVTVTDDGKTVRVKLPPAELLDSYLIDDSTQPCTTKVYDRTNLLIIPETKELEGQAREKALEAIRATAMQSGILSDARRNAEIAIERILLNSGYEKVEFVEE